MICMETDCVPKSKASGNYHASLSFTVPIFTVFVSATQRITKGLAKSAAIFQDGLLWSCSTAATVGFKASADSTAKTFSAFGGGKHRQHHVQECSLLSQLSSVSRRDTSINELSLHKPCFLRLCATLCRWWNLCQYTDSSPSISKLTTFS